MDFFPGIIRTLFFKIIFKKFGNNNMIDYKTFFRYPWKIEIGSNVSINRLTSIYGSFHKKEALVIIGNNVSIGPEVSIFSAGHDYTGLNLPDTGKSIIINDYVWIGGRAILLPGVELGEGAVVGAGSVVTRSIPPYTVVAGNPAKEIKKRKIIEPFAKINGDEL